MPVLIEHSPPISLVRRKSQCGRFYILSVCLCVTLLISMLADRRRPDALSTPLESIDHDIDGWKVVEQQSLPPGLFSKLRPTSYISRIYRRENRDLGLFIAYYAQQHAGETMHSPRVCLPGAGWDIVQQDSTFIRVQGKTMRVNRYRIQNSGVHMLVFYWYQSRGRVVASEFLGKVLLFKDAISRVSTSGSIVRIMLPDDADGLQEGPQFAANLIPQVQRCFGLWQ